MDGKQTPGFILGLPRSGTTLLSRLLNNHPSIAVPAEPWIMLALESLGLTSIRHPANAQAIGSATRDFLVDDIRRATIRAAADAAYDGWRQRLHKPVIIDKTPRYYLIAPFLAEIFPDAKFIVLLRDPFDIATSYRTTWQVDLPRLLREEADDPLAFDLPVGLDALESFIADHPGQVHVVRYEDLAADPQTTLAGILAHLGLPVADGEAGDLTRLDRPPPASRMGDRKILETSSPHARSIGGWQASFDAPDRQLLLDAVGASRMRRLGYAATVEALLAAGTLDRGDDLAAHHRDRLQAHIRRRRDDMARESTLGVDLPAAVQRRAHAALAGDAAWRAETAALLDTLRETLEHLEQRRQQERDAWQGEWKATVTALEATVAAVQTTLQGEIDRRIVQERIARERADANEAMQRDLTVARAEIDRLNRELSRREVRLHTLLGSTSWRMTAPLRAFASLFRSSS